MSRRDGIGCKGGTSATAGQKSALYEVTLPDGTTTRKRTFKATGDTATAILSFFQGRWYVDGVHDVAPTWASEGDRRTAEARKVG